ncbi:MAG TPA: MBL fold metallo-hydrolase [Steroidobacteraceae bacterium]|nr:MBL fold metallo-hydrolase [Steroidobacteraceae bacterium]
MLKDSVAEIKVLSHACMLARFGNTSIIIDPWLLGSCYWRSWWNFPEPQFDADEVRAVDAVVISHIHWDHWHGPTIKRLLKDRPFIVADEPHRRSADDLRRIGVRDVTCVPHGGSVVVGDGVKLTLHQFGLWTSDTAIAIELGATKILNANDAKIAGLPLRRLLRRHGRFDFALRSHSSANARSCFRVEGQSAVRDDAMHYARSFQLFMQAVQPRYAVPFASNHCYLHTDTESFNDLAVNPLRLRAQLEQLGGLAGPELVVMAPGSSWRANRGFELASTQAFENPAQYIADYRVNKSAALAANLAEEQRVEIASAVWHRLLSHLKRIPRWRRRLGRIPGCGIELYWPDGRQRWFELDVAAAKVIEVQAQDAASWPARMRWPAAVFRDVVMKCMYSQGMISKRFQFVGKSQRDLDALIRTFGLLGQVEAGVFPLRMPYLLRTIRCYARRWAELLVYLQAAYLIVLRGRPGYEVEEILLRAVRTGGQRNSSGRETEIATPQLRDEKIPLP